MDHDTRDLLIVAFFAGAAATVACLIWQANAVGPPWPARHPIVSGLAVGLAVALIGRVYLFMRRIEDRR